jgi:hypothetical protein
VPWPKYKLSKPETIVFDVNATELCRVQKDDFRSEAITHWMNIFSTKEYRNNRYSQPSMFPTTTFLYAFWILSSKIQIPDTHGFLLQDATLGTSLAKQGIAGTGSDLRHQLLC